jgi:hypothetical protein
LQLQASVYKAVAMMTVVEEMLPPLQLLTMLKIRHSVRKIIRQILTLMVMRNPLFQRQLQVLWAKLLQEI